MNQFTQTVKKCRSRETSADPGNRSDKNSSYRQCLITALLANEVLGLDIYTEIVYLDNGFRGEYYFNKDNANAAFDFCEEQFTYKKILARKRERKVLASPEALMNFSQSVKTKYEILKQKFQSEIEKIFK